MRKIICALGNAFFSARKKPTPDAPKKILVMRSGAIGDVLMTTPLLASIRKRFPAAEISYVVGNWSKEVLANNPHVDRIIVFDDAIFFKKKFLAVNRLRRNIAKERFDLCFVLDKSYLFNLFAYFCRIPFRIGFDRAGEGFSNTIRVPYDGSKHEVDYYLALAKSVGADSGKGNPELFPSKKDEAVVTAFLRKNKLTRATLIGLSPGGAENPGQKVHSKRWPKERYVSLIKKLTRKGTAVLLFGGQLDATLYTDIISRVDGNVLNVAGKLSIPQSYLLMKKCRLFISHDSGAMHLAGAAGIPLIALFGPTPAHRFAPKKSVVIKAKSTSCPCYDIYGTFNCTVDCMSLISIEDVVQEVRRLHHV